jgi:radical SAM superfamily enzyme YgiQ (UPF0313 family)
VTALPESVPEADHLVLGEAEELIPQLAADLSVGRARRVYREERKPDPSLTPIPRFDLLRIEAYHYLAVQFARGCPFLCEFCDIITLYGRRPRPKSPDQLVAELDAIRNLGFDGRVMFVDDNFIGDPKAVARLLPEVAAWRRRTRSSIEFFTEASINLADDPALVRLMTDAGFAVVFVGLETPSEDALRETRKVQNLRGDVVEKVRSLRRQGLDVWGGFILGFDQDDHDIFDRMIDFVENAGVVYATVGLLMALPNTPLYQRLEREGRLRPEDATGDNLMFSNVVTKLPAEALLAGYIRVLETLYDPERYFQRCHEHLRHWRAAPGLVRSGAPSDLAVVWRSIRAQGLRGGYRRAYWRFLGSVAWKHPTKLSLAISQACAGHHFIRYTHETVVPALKSRLAELQRETGRPGEAAASPPWQRTVGERARVAL